MGRLAGFPPFGGQRRCIMRIPILAVAMLLLTIPATARAQTAPSALVNVTTCDPQRSISMPAYSGFAPAFYPIAPYYWTDPYGFEFNQLPPTPASGTLSIDYTNVTNKVMTTIDFGLVARGRLVAEVRDVGKFSPHIEIKHQFGLDRNVFPLRTALSTCVPLHIVYADQTTWTNPHLPKADRHMFGRRHHQQ
jgi:hypothetical protein